MEFTCYSEHIEFVNQFPLNIVFIRDNNLIRVNFCEEIEITMDMEDLYENELLLKFYIASLVLTENYEPIDLSDINNYKIISTKILVYKRPYIFGRKNVLKIPKKYFDDRRHPNSKFDSDKYFNSLERTLTPLYGFLQEDPYKIKLKLSSNKKFYKFNKLFYNYFKENYHVKLDKLINEYFELQYNELLSKIVNVEKFISVYKLLSHKKIPIELTNLILKIY